MFSKKVFTGTKRALAVFLATCMMVGMFTCLSFVTVLTAVADEPVATETAVFIGKTGAEKQAAAFIPVDIPDPDSTTDNLFEGEVYFQVSFKCKMLSGSKPVVGVYDLDDSNNKAWARADWCDQDTVKIEDGICTAMIKVNFHRRANPNSQGYRSFYLVIGNSYYNGSSTSYGDFESSFIMSDVKLFQYDEDEGELVYDDEKGEYTNYLPDFTSSNINFKGTYFFIKDGCDNWDSPLGADAMNWHIMAAPDYVKAITVASDYNTSDNYAAANFEKTAETELTREYFTNENYEGLYFAALKNSNDAGFEIISKDINKKMVIIDANHEGEADVNNGDDGVTAGAEYSPKYNRAANIFLPISYGQYAMTGSTTQDISFLVKITFKAVLLEGNSAPVIGRIVGKKGPSSGKGSQALCKAAYNIPEGNYAGDAETYNETFKDAEGKRLKCEYDAETGDFTGWMRVRCADNDYASRWGVNEIITIGNAEHVWAGGGKFDSTSFNSSFAISNIKVDLYACSGSPYVVGDLVAEDIAPDLTADTLDTTTKWAYQYRPSSDGSSYECSNHDADCIRAPQKLWSAEGNVGMVHSANLTECMANGHTVTHHEATEGTREYWECSCGRNFAESYCETEIEDLSATKQIIYIPVSENPATAFIPLKLCGYEGNRWFKFTCKCKLIGGESVPVVSTLYNVYNGSNQCETTVVTSNDGDMAVIDYSYDPETYTLTAYIKCWIKDIINQKDRYPFERINPVSGANMAIVIGNGRYIGNGYTDYSNDTDFAISEPELYMLDCTKGAGGIEDAKDSDVISENLITPITDKTVDLDAEYVATWTNANNPLAAPQGKWYVTGADKENIYTRNLPNNYFSDDYVECAHENTHVEPAVASTCSSAGNNAYTVCDDCGAILDEEGNEATSVYINENILLPLDPDNHDGELSEEYGYNEENHWHICSACGMPAEITAHTFIWEITKEATEEEPGIKSELCSVCGYETGNTEEVPFDSHMPGDVNNDGKVNNKDLTRLFQKLSGWTVDVNEKALDINNDGKVNNKDLTRLFQYLSGWSVEIF